MSTYSLPGRSLPSWFTLWIKPDQTLINKLDQERMARLLKLLSWYQYLLHILLFEPTSYIGMVGSKYYDLIQHTAYLLVGL